MIPDLRLVVPAAVCWLSAGLLVTVPSSVGLVGVISSVFAVICLCLLFWRTRPTHRTRVGAAARPVWGTLLVCGAIVGLTSVVVGVHAPLRVPAVLEVAARKHQTLSVTATVWSLPMSAPGGVGAGAGSLERVRFRATASDLTVPGSKTAGVANVRVPLLVFASAQPAEGMQLRIGEVVRLEGTLTLTPAGDTTAALFFAAERPRSLEPPGWMLAWANDLRWEFSQNAGRLPGDGGDLLPGLAIGDTSSVNLSLDAAMKSSSLSHLTAVSGANCAIVIAGIMLLGGRVGLRRGVRIGLALVALAGFVVLVTPEPSVLRSAVMACVALVSLGMGRPGRGLPTLALSVLVLLLIEPWLSHSYGFALSVLATAGLLVLAGPLARALGRWMPSGLALVISIPLAAQLACQPVLLLLNPTVALYGVPANLLAEPAAPIATVIGLLSCLAQPVLPGLATALAHLAWLPSAWIAAVARTTAALPGNSLPWLGGVAGALALAALTGLALTLLLARRESRSRRWSAAALAVLLTCTGAYAGTLLGSQIGRAARFPADWQIAACDIGQGDAVVVRDASRDASRGDSRYALVDVGPDPALLEDCLSTLGITRINLLVLTHYDLDHVGGLRAVLGRVDTALVGIPENAEDEGLHQQLAQGGATVRQTAAGDQGTLGVLDWRILWPVSGSTRMQTGNPGSVTIEFAGRGIRSVFLGDLGEDAQNALLRASPLGRVDVVKVAHHGSSDQSAALYEALGARVGLVSVGADNTYGHPTRHLLDMLSSKAIHVERTDLQGMVVVSAADDGTLLVWSERPVTPG
ncbi:ComEC/Rec2 family competence protein [Cryobacterium sp. CG_9.6]|uniref:ComEC/Rec2 family competence protein n=1 Tax=Cryobacterium sp. CG_9.6 TaxID=2760710 RepID=UPI0024762EC8|nr:ComEC/Rec2 family competence protein [Cryobacterium sp. CG_9.6]MDH6237188.1 competence protein ComEC [Cryobacterium sp. CG_9.6]